MFGCHTLNIQILTDFRFGGFRNAPRQRANPTQGHSRGRHPRTMTLSCVLVNPNTTSINVSKRRTDTGVYTFVTALTQADFLIGNNLL